MVISTPRRLFLTIGLCLVLGIVTASPAAAVRGPLVLASASVAGEASNDFVTGQSLSADGTRVAFHTLATNLDPADTNAWFDVDVETPATGAITRVSTTSDGRPANGDSLYPSLSADGLTVAFHSTATNLDPADRDPGVDVYVKELRSGQVRLASRAADGRAGTGESFDAALSGDGSVVAFVSAAANLDPRDTDTDPDIYVRDLRSGRTALASTTAAGRPGNGLNTAPALSTDGRVVAFVSTATDLVPGDRDLFDDVYVKDLQTGRLQLASTGSSGRKGSGSSFAPSVSADGRRVGFTSNSADLDPGDPDGEYDVYLKDLSTGRLQLVSIAADGTKDGRPSFTPSLSAAGTQVAFLSQATTLDPADTDRKADVYLKDLSTGRLVLLSTTAGGVKGNGDSFDPALSADARTVAFASSATNLDPADRDRTSDVYVKRVG